MLTSHQILLMTDEGGASSKLINATGHLGLAMPPLSPTAALRSRHKPYEMSYLYYRAGYQKVPQCTGAKTRLVLH